MRQIQIFKTSDEIRTGSYYSEVLTKFIGEDETYIKMPNQKFREQKIFSKAEKQKNLKNKDLQEPCYPKPKFNLGAVIQRNID